MSKKAIAAIVIFLVIVIGGAVQLLARKDKAPVLISRTDPPKISFEEKLHELGTVAEGVEVPYVFRMHNVGGEPLVIQDVSTSCGCTLLNLKDKFIEPGKTGDLEVVMDTTMKQGYVKKRIDVFSNDPEHPKVSVFLAANVLPGVKSKAGDKSGSGMEEMSMGLGKGKTAFDPHVGLSETGKAKIFTGRCATCHVQMGKGKLGGDLFQADCAMCHGQNAEGAEGPALVPGNYHDAEFFNHIQKVVRYGSPTHVSMPGFLKDAGGPLTEGEINSILLYLQNKSDQVKGQNSEPPGG
jgi:mono/diheme cytochrome c family protein